MQVYLGRGLASIIKPFHIGLWIRVLIYLMISLSAQALVLENTEIKESQPEADPIASGLRLGASPTLSESPLLDILIPSLDISDGLLSDLLEEIASFSRLKDEHGLGLNIALIHPDPEKIRIQLSLRDIPLKSLLQLLAEMTGLSLDFRDRLVLLKQSSLEANLPRETRIFPLSKAVAGRMTGLYEQEEQHYSLQQYQEGLHRFFKDCGISDAGDFSLAYDGSQIIVTHSAQALDRLAHLLQQYQSVRQVKVETQFWEISEGVLEELSLNAFLLKDSNGAFFQTMGDASERSGTTQTQLRSISAAFKTENFTSGPGRIVGEAVPQGILSLPNQVPALPGALNLGSNVLQTLGLSKKNQQSQIKAFVRALEQKHGSDLMSAPSVTVVSGQTARMSVTQELIYPQSYGDVNPQVSGGASFKGGSTSASVAIGAATPRDFKMRDVGVQMEVTPTVEESGLIHLKIKPEVTEFEGFIEYGGRSVALTSQIATEVPSGFLQPIFSTRSVATELTLEDGATVILGGLTREESVKVEDKVPVLGDLPFFGRLFRSKGMSSQKRNLMIILRAEQVPASGVDLAQVTAAMDMKAKQGSTQKARLGRSKRRSKQSISEAISSPWSASASGQPQSPRKRPPRRKRTSD